MRRIATKADFLEELRGERLAWQALLGRIHPQDMERPGWSGSWSVRDLVVHVTAYERGLVEWLEAARRGEALTFPVLDHPDIDYRNALILERYQDWSLGEVLAEAERVFQALLAVVEAVPEAELLHPGQTEWYVKPRWGQRRALWECIADDSCRHYQQHLEELSSWLESD